MLFVCCLLFIAGRVRAVYVLLVWCLLVTCMVCACCLLFWFLFVCFLFDCLLCAGVHCCSLLLVVVVFFVTGRGCSLFLLVFVVVRCRSLRFVVGGRCSLLLCGVCSSLLLFVVARC